MLHAFKIRLRFMYAPNLPSRIIIFVQEMERGCFNLTRNGASREHRGSIEGARQGTGSAGGALQSTGRARKEHCLDS